MKSGMLAAEAAYDEVVRGDEQGEGAEVGHPARLYSILTDALTRSKLLPLQSRHSPRNLEICLLILLR